jgi:hypothetical protein
MHVQGPCGCWVEKECASMLLQHLQLGFELDVYAPEEYCMLFWCAVFNLSSFSTRSSGVPYAFVGPSDS